MAVTATAAAVIMKLLRSPLVGGCTHRPVAEMYASGLKSSSSMASRASPCSGLLSKAGTGGALRTLTAVAATAEPGSRRRRSKASNARHQEQPPPPPSHSSSGSTSEGSSSSSRAAASRRTRRSRTNSSGIESSSSSRLGINIAAGRSASSTGSSMEEGRGADWSGGATQDSASDSAADGISFSSRDDAVVSAIARLGCFLDFRERCGSEVLTKLAALGYDGQLARRVLQGLQSDARFAEMFVRGYWRAKAQSPARLAYELRSRGVAQQHIDAAMADVFGPGRQLPSREAANDQEAEMWEHLVEVCRRRAELTRMEPQQKRRAKLAGWLQRRGHTMSTIFRIFEAVGI
ncbi:RecX family-domain-containing protein [Scenedesmus sp. NREL 46B-D3]|nr:RecX family-domain-containing protein [Scenedesmus sp. NREL 46B-D3]